MLCHHLDIFCMHDYNRYNLWMQDSCTKRRCFQGASTDLLDKTSHLNTFCVWDSSPHLLVTPAAWWDWPKCILHSGWLCWSYFIIIFPEGVVHRLFLCTIVMNIDFAMFCSLKYVYLISEQLSKPHTPPPTSCGWYTIITRDLRAHHGKQSCCCKNISTKLYITLTLQQLSLFYNAL